MANTDSTSALDILPAGPDDLVVILASYPFDFSELIGSRSMLEAEGVIPTDFKWPDGYIDRRWKDGKFKYWLRRQRPNGAKGPRRQFIDCDWWCLRWELVNQPSAAQRAIDQKTKALREEIYRHSARGQAERDQQWKRYWKTVEDEKFQSFKALIPGLNRPKRGRPQAERSV